ncbi:PHP domain-containing protein [Nocardioides guangzhouensis]|uniref:Histidinol-phosphatase n=1 Tax=Nocardioides guangzhouensis TaxID=2497878 RepID=A0A4Q4Z3F5_9ACTN|nr:PHP domain-containing protein [Nocardioides guangzhouensis]RYP82173.1 PHP domain-containing protein [Nocardioides guangzhouensis]
MSLPSDGHVHTEWSWDAPTGSMERSCARAVAIGLPAIAFTEHVDHTVTTVPVDRIEPGHLVLELVAPDGRLTPPALDVEGYLAAVERCRDLFPDLRILSGLELGEPHWHRDAVRRLVAAGDFDRVLGSLHCLPYGDGFREPPGLFGDLDPHEIVRGYLAEVVRLVADGGDFAALAHVDYPLRFWDAATDGPYDVATYEDDFRLALRALAGSGRALEINTVLPLDATVLRWWREEGGQGITFGSDAHEPEAVARRLRDAAAMATAFGFRPGRDPFDVWPRS